MNIAAAFIFIMKKLLKIVLAVIILSIGVFALESKTTNVYAYDTDEISVDVNLNAGDKGNVKAGDTVTIKLKFNKVTDLYAASFNYTYDPNLLQVNSIDVNEEIESSGVYQPYKDTAKDGNRARYCFTFLGDGNGLSGDYDFITINAQAKADGKVTASADNIKCELIQRIGDKMVKNNYYLDDGEGDVYKVTNVEGSKDNSNGNAENNAAGGNPAQKSADVNIELVQKAGEKAEGSDNNSENNGDSENNNSNTDEQSDNIDPDKKDGEDNSSNLENEESKNSEESTAPSGEKNNNAVIISVIAVVMIIIISFVVYLKKRVKIQK